MMEFREFHNGLRILINIDRDELVDAGVLDRNDFHGWLKFGADPFRWFVKASDEQAGKLWALMKKRMQP